MSNWYDRAGKPIDALTANDLLGDPKYKRVALTRVTSGSDPNVEYRVSTVWLGLDHNWGGGEPLLFETMSFGGGRGSGPVAVAVDHRGCRARRAHGSGVHHRGDRCGRAG